MATARDPRTRITDGDPAGRVANSAAAEMLHHLQLQNLRHWSLYGDTQESRERARRELLRIGEEDS